MTVKLTRLQVDGIRANTERFLTQEGGSTIALMPMAPKRLLAMCDTIDELFDEVDLLTSKVNQMESEI